MCTMLQEIESRIYNNDHNLRPYFVKKSEERRQFFKNWHAVKHFTNDVILLTTFPFQQICAPDIPKTLFESKIVTRARHIRHQIVVT